MDPRRQAVPVAALVPPGSCNDPVHRTLSRQNSMVEDVAAVRPDNAAKQRQLTREAERQSHFQRISNSVLEVPNYYRKVEVTIIRWHESIDEFKGHDAEIEELQSIFVKDFGFSCKVVKLRNDMSPQLDLNFAILSQVREHHDDRTLNIFYYTGHGFRRNGPDGARLELAANRDWSPRSGYYDPIAYWDEAEKPLLSHGRCDVLVILDCCFASTAAVKGEDEGLRSYQLLAASPPDGRTFGPGDKSFTHALCVSLKLLLKEASGGTFRVDQLQEKINGLRLTHASLIWNRLQTHGHSINLGRLEKSLERRDSVEKKDIEKASLRLRISLKVSDLNNNQIETLARRLPEICKEAKIPVRRIDWVTMEEQNPGRRLRDAVGHVINIRRHNSTPEGSLEDTPVLGSKKRTWPGTPSPAGKRQAQGAGLTPHNRSNPRPLTPESGGDR